ncbi:helix-turn-helix domain-containing protein [Mammaliicoccus sciuri]|uniref:Two-component response regulator, YesN/AraC family, consists of REC and AraC-type DNA-binding domains n=2 Tax=Sporosarcina newyorkensis TaxID=759851 RepID=A0A1T4YAW1_9BACL|nr:MULTISPECIES: helix-turn-helix domain-containing protein [Sporosarcina]EGQ26266.1 AraC family two component transcriptional regulator [Sporosarcina newyorkensis 2681]MBY0223679.1 AraC family transcriptional regulator [Sporosarcina aquimarina]SKA98813.1 Two-component response regulator, YesN/AraC family, consists of REC and AraC-type DNA-binding domains [Sporosarcina newyorkensis]
MKILIAERDELERKGIRWVLLSNQILITQLKETDNEEECLDILFDWKPDILIVELEMLTHSRKQLTNLLRELEIKTIVHTHHKTFEAAEQSLNMKAEALFIKPYDTNEWLHTMKNTVINSHKKTSEDKENFIHHGWAYDLLFGRVFNDSLILDQVRTWGYQQIPTLVVALSLDKSNQGEVDLTKLVHFINSEFQSYRPFVLIVEDHLVLLFSGEYLASDQEPIHSLRRILVYFCQKAKSERGLSFSASIGKWYNNPKMVHQSYWEAKRALLRRFYFGGNHVFPPIENLVLTEIDPFLSPEESDEFMKHLRNIDREMLKNWLNDQVNNYSITEESFPDSENVRIRLTNILSHIRRFMLEKVYLLEEEHLYKKLFNNILSGEVLFDIIHNILSFCYRLCDQVEKEETSYNSILIKKAIQYINENYATSITLEDISAFVNRNSQYFSSMFRKQMGCTFTDYLQRKRIKEAQVLLMGTTMTVSEIAEQVGFTDPGYFSRVFKKVIGYSPSFWRTHNNPTI